MPRPKTNIPISKADYAESMDMSTKTILRWVCDNPKLIRELWAVNWNVNSKHWKPKEVKILNKYFK